jgi:hypothetical protein
MHERRSGRFYSTWEIELYEGNDPAWLLAHHDDLCRYIKESFGYPHVSKVRVVGAK